MTSHPLTPLLILAVMAGTLIAPPVHAAACDPAVQPAATGALATWERRTGIALAASVRADVLKEFCQSAQELIAEKKAEPAAIAAVAQKALDEHLDREVDPVRPARSIGAVLRAEFKAAGFSRPQARRRVLVSMAYTKDVDALLAGDDAYPKAKALLLPTGAVTLKALHKTKVVCTQSLDLKVGVDAVFSC